MPRTRLILVSSDDPLEPTIFSRVRRQDDANARKSTTDKRIMWLSRSESEARNRAVMIENDVVHHVSWSMRVV
jgi:hypothetical protein